MIIMEVKHNFETPEYRFSKLFPEFIFWEYMRNSLKEGTPSEFLLELSKILNKNYNKGKIDFEGEDALKVIDDIIRDKAEKLSEIMKESFPEAMKEDKSECKTKEEKVEYPKNGLYSVFLDRMKELKPNSSGIIRFPVVFEKLCASFQITKKQCWDILFMFRDFGLIEIVKGQGIKIIKS